MQPLRHTHPPRATSRQCPRKGHSGSFCPTSEGDSEQVDRIAFERYLDVVNRALIGVRGQFPYSTVLRSLNALLRGNPFVVAIGEDVQDETLLACRLEGSAFSWVETLPEVPATRWRLRREHVNEVVTEPWRFLADLGRFEIPPFAIVNPRRVFGNVRDLAHPTSTPVAGGPPSGPEHAGQAADRGVGAHL